MQKLIELNENQDTPLYRFSHLQELRHRSEYSEVPDLTQEFKDMITLITDFNEIPYK